MTKRDNPFKRFFLPYRYDASVFDLATGVELRFFQSSFRAWFADPFLFSNRGGEYQMFVELMATNHKRGKIAVFSNSSTGYQIALSEPFHLSFPNVFRLNGKIYMMPESSAIKEVRLYECEDYPSKFVYTKTLLKGEKYADSVLFEYKGDYFLGTYSSSVTPSQLRIYRFDPVALEVKECVLVENDPDKVLRPAGNPFLDNGQLFCPMHIGTHSYGEDVAFYSFEIKEGHATLDKSEKQTPLPSRKVKYKHMHTFNVCGGLACVAFAKNHFSLIQGIYGLPASIRIRKHVK